MVNKYHLPREEYESAQGTRVTTLKSFRSMPAQKFFYKETQPFVETPEIAEGTIAHITVEALIARRHEPFQRGVNFEEMVKIIQDKVSDKYFTVDRSKMPFPNNTMAKKENKAWLEEITKANEGKIEISQKNILAGVNLGLRFYYCTDEAIASVNSSFADIYSEMRCVVDTPAGPLKGTIDALIVNKDIFGVPCNVTLIDYKTTHNASPKFKWIIQDSQYHFQLAAYYYIVSQYLRDTYQIENPESIVTAMLIAGEKEPPHLTSKWYMPTTMLEAAPLAIESTLRSYLFQKSCNEQDGLNAVPGYGNAISDINIIEGEL